MTKQFFTLFFVLYTRCIIASHSNSSGMCGCVNNGPSENSLLSQKSHVCKRCIRYRPPLHSKSQFACSIVIGEMELFYFYFFFHSKKIKLKGSWKNQTLYTWQKVELLFNKGQEIYNRSVVAVIPWAAKVLFTIKDLCIWNRQFPFFYTTKTFKSLKLYYNEIFNRNANMIIYIITMRKATIAYNFSVIDVYRWFDRGDYCMSSENAKARALLVIGSSSFTYHTRSSTSLTPQLPS